MNEAGNTSEARVEAWLGTFIHGLRAALLVRGFGNIETSQNKAQIFLVNLYSETQILSAAPSLFHLCQNALKRSTLFVGNDSSLL